MSESKKKQRASKNQPPVLVKKPSSVGSHFWNRWINESRDISVEYHNMVVTVQREFMTVFEQLRQGDPDQSRGGKTTDFDAHLLHDLAKEWIERDMPVEWKELDMSEETRSQFQKMGIELMSLIAKVQIYETNRKDIGIDMGKSNIATAVYQDTSLQRVHAPMRKQKKEDRFKTLSIPTSPEVSLYPPFEAGARPASWSNDDTWSGSVFLCID